MPRPVSDLSAYATGKESTRQKFEIRFQASIDRGQFYCWANKLGTVADADGRLCRAGNCEPAWVREHGSDLQGTAKDTYKYKVPSCEVSTTAQDPKLTKQKDFCLFWQVVSFEQWWWIFGGPAKVSGDWPRKLWQEYKLHPSVYEEYLYLSRDKLAANKRNLEVHQHWKQDLGI